MSEKGTPALANLLNLSAIFLGLPYFAGYIFLHSYYNTFGISVSELDFQDSFIYISAFSFAAQSILNVEVTGLRIVSIIVVVVVIGSLRLNAISAFLNLISRNMGKLGFIVATYIMISLGI